MLLREVFKGDTSASSQIKLETESVAMKNESEKRKLEENCSDEEQNSANKKTKVDGEDGVKDAE